MPWFSLRANRVMLTPVWLVNLVNFLLRFPLSIVTFRAWVVVSPSSLLISVRSVALWLVLGVCSTDRNCTCRLSLHRAMVEPPMNISGASGFVVCIGLGVVVVSRIVITAVRITCCTVTFTVAPCVISVYVGVLCYSLCVCVAASGCLFEVV